MTKKRISALLVVAMVLSLLFAYPAAASTAVSGVVVGNVPTIVATGPVTLASIRYAETTPGNIQGGNVITVELPSGVNFAAGSVASAVFLGNGVTATAKFYPSAAATSQAGDNKVELTLTRTADLNTNASFLLQLPANVTTMGTPPGSVTATVSTNTTAVAGGSFTVGTYGTAAVAVSATGTVSTVSRFVTSPQSLGARTIRLAENAPGAFKTGSPANRVVLTLPAGATWDDVPTLTGGIDAAIRSGDPTKLDVSLGTATGSATTFTLSNISLNINRLAPLGDLVVTIAGEGTNSGITGSLVLATVADFDITVRRLSTSPVANLNAGNIGTLATLELVEATPGSLIQGGYIEVALPEGLRFSAAPTATTLAGNVVVDANGTVVPNTNDSKYRFGVTAVSTAASKVTISGNVLVSPKFSGDVAVAVSGTASAAGSAVLANVRPTASFTASSVPSLRTGITGQDAGNIVITEAAAGRIGAGNIVLTLPTGVTFSGTPTVTRTSGNITLGTASVTGGNTLTIPVSAVSTVASVITVSGIKYNVDRLVPDGNIELSLDATSTSLIHPNVAAATPAFPAVKVFNARIGAAGSTVFTIGALNYTVDGRSYTMDVAPVIKAGRTLLPLRFAAQAAGVNADEVIWDPVRKAVTLIRGDRVVQVTIGSTTMLINGAVVTMDVAPEIIDGRTMLPIRWIGLALRANVEWDGTARTVTVMPY